MEKKIKEEAQEVIAAFKGFDANMQCRGYQFEVGKTYEHTGKVEACESGFHSCENPLDVLNYYSLIGDNGEMNRFASVKAFGEISRHGEDSKIASAKISIEAELKIPEIVSAAIKWISSCASKDNIASGDSSQLAASGHSSQLAASGDSSQLAASGHYSKLAASGDYSKLAASGKSSIAAAVSFGCIAKAGDLGCIALTRWVDSENRYRMSVAYVGENGIKPNVFYKLDDEGSFVEA